MKSSITTKLCALVAVILLLATVLCSCNEDWQPKIDEANASATNAQTAADQAKTAADEAKTTVNQAVAAAATQLTAAKDELTNAITAVQTAIASKASIADLSDANAKLEAAIAAAKTAYEAADAELQGKIDALAKAYKDADAALETSLKGLVAENAKADEATAARLDKAIKDSADATKALVNDKVVELKALIGKCVSTEAFDAKVGELTTLIGTKADKTAFNLLAEDVEDLAEDVKKCALAADLDALDERVETAENDILYIKDNYVKKIAIESMVVKADLDAAVKKLEDADKELQEQIDKLVKDLDEAEDDIDNLESALAAYKLANAAVVDNLMKIAEIRENTDISFYTNKEAAEDDTAKKFATKDNAAIINRAYYTAFANVLRATTEEEAAAAAATYAKYYDKTDDLYVETIIDQAVAEINKILADGKVKVDEELAVAKLVNFWNEWVAAVGRENVLAFAKTHDLKLAVVQIDYAVETINEYYKYVTDELAKAIAKFIDDIKGISSVIATVWADGEIDDDEINLMIAQEKALEDLFKEYPEYVGTNKDGKYYAEESDLKFFGMDTVYSAKPETTKLCDVNDAAISAKNTTKAAADKAVYDLAVLVKAIINVNINSEKAIEDAEAFRDANVYDVATFTKYSNYRYDLAVCYTNEELEFTEKNLLTIITDSRAKYDILAAGVDAFIVKYAQLVDAARVEKSKDKIDISDEGIVKFVIAAEEYCKLEEEGYSGLINEYTDAEDVAYILAAITDYSNDTDFAVIYENEDLPAFLAEIRAFYEQALADFKAAAADFTKIIDGIISNGGVTLADGKSLDEALAKYTYWQDHVTNIDSLDIPVGEKEQPIKLYVTEYNKMLLEYQKLKEEYKTKAIEFVANVAAIKLGAGAAPDYATILSQGTAITLAKNIEYADFFKNTVVIDTFPISTTISYQDVQDAVTDFETLTDEYNKQSDEVYDLCVTLNTAINDKILANSIYDCADRAEIIDLADTIADIKAAKAIMDIKVAKCDDGENSYNVETVVTNWDSVVVAGVAAAEANRNDLYAKIVALKANIAFDAEAINQRFFTTFNKTAFETNYLNPVNQAAAKFDGIEDRNIKGYKYIKDFAPDVDLEGQDAAIDTTLEDLEVMLAKVYAVVNAQEYATTFELAVKDAIGTDEFKTILENALYTHTQAIKASSLTDVDKIAAMGADTKVKEILDKVLYDQLVDGILEDEFAEFETATNCFDKAVIARVYGMAHIVEGLDEIYPIDVAKIDAVKLVLDTYEAFVDELETNVSATFYDDVQPILYAIAEQAAKDIIVLGNDDTKTDEENVAEVEGFTSEEALNVTFNASVSDEYSTQFIQMADLALVTTVEKKAWVDAYAEISDFENDNKYTGTIVVVTPSAEAVTKAGDLAEKEEAQVIAYEAELTTFTGAIGTAYTDSESFATSQDAEDFVETYEDMFVAITSAMEYGRTPDAGTFTSYAQDMSNYTIVCSRVTALNATILETKGYYVPTVS